MNCQSIKSKKADLELVIDDHEPDILMGTESWLTSDTYNSEIFPSSYSILRKDRLSNTHGGGVFQAIKNDLIISQKQEFDTNCEIIWSQCQIQGLSSLYIGTFYNPNGNTTTLEELHASLLKIGDRINNKNIILTGDFNIPNIDWNNNTVTSIPYGPPTKLLELMAEHGLHQMVREPTRRRGNAQNILDLVFTNNESIIQNLKVIPGISDHEMVSFNINLKSKRKKIPKRTFFIRRKANVDQMKSDMLSFCDYYMNHLKGTSVDNKWNKLEQAIKESMKANIPCKTTSSRFNLPWFNRSHRRLCRKKQKLYNNAKTSGNENDWAKYRSAKKKLRQEISKARNDYVSGFLTESIQENPKSFWSYIKKTKSSDQVGIPDLNINGQLTSDPYLKAKALNDHFCSVFTKEDNTSIPVLPPSNITTKISPITVTCKGVEKQLQNLKCNKATGPDGLPPWILKLLSSELSPILTDIFQASLDQGELPSKWKEANIHGVFKKGKKEECENYRPISLTCIACKVLEHIVHSHVMKFLEANNILVDSQHGFRQKRSTVTQLLSTIHEISSSLNQKKTSHLAILDFTKAFDKVPHERLLLKLFHYGIDGKINIWIRNFLTFRVQQTVCDGTQSPTQLVTSGVPQGTVLGPLLFLLYVNDLTDNLECSARLFADDCLLYIPITTTDDMNKLQSDFYKLEQWQKTWQMKFNPTKCFIMCISLKRDPPHRTYMFCNTALAYVDMHPYLGVTLDTKLRWNRHIHEITLKATKTLNLIKRNFWFCEKSTKDILYKSLVRPKLEYASEVWDPHFQCDVKKLESVQRAAARFCKRDYSYKSSVTIMLKDLEWEPLALRRKQARLMTMYKITNDIIHIDKSKYLLPPTETRTRRSHNFKYYLEQTNNDVFKFSYFPRTIREWNSLPANIVSSTSLDIFQRKLGLFLRED